MDQMEITSLICKITSKVKRKVKMALEKTLKMRMVNKRGNYNTRKENILLKTEQSIVVNGWADSATALANKHGLMEPVMRVSGKTIKHTVEEFSIMSMATSSMVSGATTKLTATAPTSM